MDDTHEVTRLLLAWTGGNKAALSQLLPMVENELRRIAKRSMKRERPDHTLQPTALVHEVYLRLVDRRQVSWRNRAHFFGFTAQLMRRILVDYARRRMTAKRGEEFERVGLDEARDATEQRDIELIALDDALKDLKRIYPRQSSVVEMHYFAGLRYEEIGEALGVSAATVKRDFRVARLWLYEELKPDASQHSIPSNRRSKNRNDDETG